VSKTRDIFASGARIRVDLRTGLAQLGFLASASTQNAGIMSPERAFACPSLSAGRLRAASEWDRPMVARPEDESNELSAIRSAGSAIGPLHEPIGAIQQGDWLDKHEEPGQSFEEYRRSHPRPPTKLQTTMYLQPIGDLDAARAAAIEATAEFLCHFYGAPVRILERMDLAWVPDEARRIHPYTGAEQILTKFVLRLLGREKPADAMTVLALTTSDLWPGEGWNFVFGQASRKEGVGVWSLHRLGDPELEAGTFLRRTAKIAVHETGHTLGISHCTAYECGMNGSNHLAEADARPMWFCPEDEMKIWWACRVNPAERYGRLAEVAARKGLPREAEFWRTSERAILESGSI
jgi:archaemetzincin